MDNNKENLDIQAIDQVNEGFGDADTVTHHMILHRLHDRLNAEGYKISQTELWKYYDYFIDSAVQALAEGKTVRLSKFAEFKYVDRAPRKGVNPQTGEELNIPAKRVIRPRPLRKLTDLTIVKED